MNRLATRVLVFTSVLFVFGANHHGSAQQPGFEHESSSSPLSIGSQARVQRPEIDEQQMNSSADLQSEFPLFESADEQSKTSAGHAGSNLIGPAVTTVSALTIVLAIFGGFVWVSRRFGSASVSSGSLPSDVFQKLGSTQIDAKTRVTFLKVGQRIIVVGQNAAGDPQTLTEITDPDEVDRLTGRCQGRPEIVGRRTVSGTATMQGGHRSYSEPISPNHRNVAAG